MAEKQRSPNYPGFGLPEGILKAKQLYESDGRSAIPRDVAVRAWGYQGTNGASLRALGALRQFGLLETPTPGSVKVSGDALVLILEPQGSTEWRAALSSVAMRPAIFRALNKQYPDGMPSDAAVISFLVRTANFSEDAARTVIAAYRETLALLRSAKPADADGDSAAEASFQSDDQRGVEEYGVTSDRGVKPSKERTVGPTQEELEIPIPIVSGGRAMLRIPRRMSEVDYAAFRSVLDAILAGMKTALVASDTPVSNEDSPAM